MAAADNPLEALPLTAQVIIYGAAGISIAVWAIHNYFVKKKEPEQHRDFVISAGSIADMAPVRDAAANLSRIATSAEEIAAIMRADDMEDRKLDERAELLKLMRETAAEMLRDNQAAHAPAKRRPKPRVKKPP